MKIELKENIEGKKSKYKTYIEFKNVKNNEYEFIFYVYQTSKYSKYSGFNEKHYESNVVELFFSDNLNREKYLEIEVSPNNSHFIAYVIKNKEGDRELEFIEKEKDFYSKIEDITDNYQKVTIKIDLDKYLDSNDFYFNAYRIEQEDKKQYLIALNPTLSETFHKTSSFIKLDVNK